MAKRKRQAVVAAEAAAEPRPSKKKAKGAGEAKQSNTAEASERKTPKGGRETRHGETKTVSGAAAASDEDKKTGGGGGGVARPVAAAAAAETIQIVAGSYDRVLHGFTATIGPVGDTVDFADTFLFNAHASAIRCVAFSPPSAPAPGQTQKVLLASGSTDERINIYSLSAHPPSRKNQALPAQVAPRPILENPKNREVGTLLHHSSTVTALRFPTRSKLLSASEDSTVAVTRTRDWSVLSTIKAPVPKVQGRPSGDTAPFGGTPSGVNDFAVHPSMKVMISVSKGERCMRLWNLVTGKKAGVFNVSRDMLHELGEGKHSTGEGRRVVWGSADGDDEFAVAFDRDAVVFGMDSLPKCRVLGPSARTKMHQLCYVTVDAAAGLSLLAASTEDGRIAFFSTRAEDMRGPQDGEGGDEAEGQPAQTTVAAAAAANRATLRRAKPVGYVGGREAGVAGRIKDFAAVGGEAGRLYVAGATSAGTVRLWRIRADELAAAGGGPSGPVGKLLGTYETQNRVTCLAAYRMIARPEGADESEEEMDGDDDEDGDEDDDGDDD